MLFLVITNIFPDGKISRSPLAVSASASQNRNIAARRTSTQNLPQGRFCVLVRPPGIEVYNFSTPCGLFFEKISHGLRSLLESAPRFLRGRHSLRSCPPTRDRTWDLLLKRELLYRLSYGRIPSKIFSLIRVKRYGVGLDALLLELWADINILQTE